MVHVFNTAVYFKTNSQDRKLQIIGCGHQGCSSEYSINRTACPFFGLEYVVKGKGSFTWDAHTEPVGKGMLFCYGGPKAHSYKADPEHPFEKVWIAFRGDEAQHVLCSILKRGTGIITVKNHERIHLLFQDCINQALTYAPESPLLISHYLMILLLRLQSMVVEDKEQHRESKLLFSSLKRSIDENFISLHSPYDLLSHFPISSSYFCRIFSKYCGKSPYDYMTGLKMNFAAHQLQTTALSIKQIASGLQYKDALHFSRLLKQYYSRSPREYRRCG